MIERKLEAVLCAGFAREPLPEAAAAGALSGAADAAAGPTVEAMATGTQVPFIRTRPGARGTVYLDFDGETVTDPSWFNGDTIKADASGLSTAQIREIVARVAEDYAPFDFNFTTDPTDYEAAPVRRRMRVIVTPTTLANPYPYRVEGVAFTHSWSRAGGLAEQGNSSVGAFRSDIPAWAFTLSRETKTIAEVISHEVGHTLGLSHDGQTFDPQITGSTPVENFGGFSGVASGPVGWAPIMGKPYTKSLTQWSKGEYVRANNTEDDLAIIAREANGVGYISPSESETSSIPIVCVADSFSAAGTLRSDGAFHRFSFATSGGSFSFSAKPKTPVFSNVDLRLELCNRSGVVIAASNDLASTSAALAGTLSAGTYEIRLHAAGAAPPTAEGYTSGYPAYGSLGPFQIDGTISGFSQKPTVTEQIFRLSHGEFFSVPNVVRGATHVSFPEQSPPDWLQLNVQTGELSGIPTLTGNWVLPLVASNSLGSTAGSLQLWVESSTLSLQKFLGESFTAVSTPPRTPWSLDLQNRADGNPGWVLRSGLTPDASTSSLRFSVATPRFSKGAYVCAFWLKVSSEFQKDFLECRVNGRLAVDSETGKPLRVSGESAWVRCKVPLPAPVAWVELRYTKDPTLAEGGDCVSVYGFALEALPVVKVMSPPVRAGAGSEIALTAEVAGATGMRWTRDGIALQDGTSGARSLEGAATPSLLLRGADVLDAGLYRLEAFNASGKTRSMAVRVAVDGPPKLEHLPLGGVRLPAGQTLSIVPRAAGTAPLLCVWRRDGRVVQLGPHPVFQRTRATPALSGKYSLTVSNRSGTVTSAEFQITIESP
jgi:hypothetical protein